MNVQIGNYTVKTMDEFNFGLYKTRAKGSFRGKQGEGEVEVHIGYYGRLSGALNKMLNDSLLSSEDITTVKDILNALTTIETQLNQAFNK